MTNSTLNAFVAYGTNAQRLAFTPSVPTPASGPSQAYKWYETDTGLEYTYASGAWHLIGSTGVGNVSGPASSTDRAVATWNSTGGVLLRDNSAVTIDASGNITTSGKATITGNVSGGNLTTAGLISATGNVSGGNLTTSGNVTGSNIGNITPVNLNGNGSTVLLGNGTFAAVPGGGGSTARSYEAGGSSLVSGNFTWVNQGNATVSDVTNAILLTAPAAGSDQLRLQLKTVPGTPFSIYMRSRIYTSVTTSTSWGLAVRNSTSGRLLTYFIYFSANWSHQLARWASATSYNAIVGSAVTLENAEAWLRLDVTSTTVTPFISYDGWNWDQFQSGDTISSYLTATGGSLDQVGFFINPIATTSLYVHYINTVTPS